VVVSPMNNDEISKEAQPYTKSNYVWSKPDDVEVKDGSVYKRGGELIGVFAGIDDATLDVMAIPPSPQKCSICGLGEGNDMPDRSVCPVIPMREGGTVSKGSLPLMHNDNVVPKGQYKGMSPDKIYIDDAVDLPPLDEEYVEEVAKIMRNAKPMLLKIADDVRLPYDSIPRSIPDDVKQKAYQDATLYGVGYIQIERCLEGCMGYSNIDPTSVTIDYPLMQDGAGSLAASEEKGVDIPKWLFPFLWIMMLLIFLGLAIALR